MQGEIAMTNRIQRYYGPEFVAKKLVTWMKSLEVQPLYIHPGSPWENGYCESFNGKMRYELLNGEIFNSRLEAKVVIENWRIHYNTRRPHSSLGGVPPAPEFFQPSLAGPDQTQLVV